MEQKRQSKQRGQRGRIYFQMRALSAIRCDWQEIFPRGPKIQHNSRMYIQGSGNRNCDQKNALLSGAVFAVFRFRVARHGAKEGVALA